MSEGLTEPNSRAVESEARGPNKEACGFDSDPWIKEAKSKEKFGRVKTESRTAERESGRAETDTRRGERRSVQSQKGVFVGGRRRPCQPRKRDSHSRQENSQSQKRQTHKVEMEIWPK